MNKIPRPILNIPPSPVNNVLDIIALAGVFLLFFLLLQNYSKLPETLPIHFKLSGNPDSWGSKLILWIFPILGLIIYLVFNIIKRFPHTFNYPWPLTEENAPQQYQLALNLISRLKPITIWLLTFVEWQMIRVGLGITSSLETVFLPLFMLIFYTENIRELGSPVLLKRGGKATRADLSAFNINVFHDVGHLYKPLLCLC